MSAYLVPPVFFNDLCSKVCPSNFNHLFLLSKSTTFKSGRVLTPTPPPLKSPKPIR